MLKAWIVGHTHKLKVMASLTLSDDHPYYTLGLGYSLQSSVIKCRQSDVVRVIKNKSRWLYTISVTYFDHFDDITSHDSSQCRIYL